VFKLISDESTTLLCRLVPVIKCQRKVCEHFDGFWWNLFRLGTAKERIWFHIRIWRQIQMKLRVCFLAS